jgi:hypothetical protein
MKIKGPGDGGPQLEGSQPTGTTGEASKASFADRMGVERTGATEAAGGAAGARNDAAALAGALRSGELTPAEALRELVVRAVDAQLGKEVSPARRTEMIESMTQLCAEDPLLADKLQRIGAKIGK